MNLAALLVRANANVKHCTKLACNSPRVEVKAAELIYNRVATQKKNFTNTVTLCINLSSSVVMFHYISDGAPGSTFQPVQRSEVVNLSFFTLDRILNKM